MIGEPVEEHAGDQQHARSHLLGRQSGRSPDEVGEEAGGGGFGGLAAGHGGELGVSQKARADAHVGHASFGTAHVIGQRTDEDFDEIAQARTRIGFQGVESFGANLLDGRLMRFADGCDEARLVAKVVLDRGAVLLAGGRADLDQGDRIDPALGEEALRDPQDPRTGRGFVFGGGGSVRGPLPGGAALR